MITGKSLATVLKTVISLVDCLYSGIKYFKETFHYKFFRWKQYTFVTKFLPVDFEGTLYNSVPTRLLRIPLIFKSSDSPASRAQAKARIFCSKLLLLVPDVLFFLAGIAPKRTCWSRKNFFIQCCCLTV